MRVVMVAARYLPLLGGIETHIHEVGTRIAARGHQLTILTTDRTGTLPAAENVAGMQVVRVPAWPKRRDYYFSPEIYTRLLQGSWDIVHFQGYHTLVAPLGMLAAMRREIPFVLTFHSGGHSSRLRNAGRRMQHQALRPLLARAARLIGVSQYEAAFFSRRLRLPRERFDVVPNGASLPLPHAGRVRDDSNLVVSIGRLERYKGHHRVLCALPELVRLVPDARLRIVGAGPYEARLRQLARSLGIERRVTIGPIVAGDRQGLADLLAQAGLVVLLSDYEAHPVAIMEALSLRRRALVSDTTGLRELAEQGLCRSISVHAPPRAVAAAMAEELLTRREVPELSLPGWDGCAAALLDIYQRALGATNPPERAGRPDCGGKFRIRGFRIAGG